MSAVFVIPDVRHYRSGRLAFRRAVWHSGGPLGIPAFDIPGHSQEMSAALLFLDVASTSGFLMRSSAQNVQFQMAVCAVRKKAK